MSDQTRKPPVALCERCEGDLTMLGWITFTLSPHKKVITQCFVCSQLTIDEHKKVVKRKEQVQMRGMWFAFGAGLVAVAWLLLGCAPAAPKQEQSLTVDVTAYRPIRAQTDGSPNWTSVGTPAIMGIVAASQDMLRDGRLHYQDVVEIPNLGVYKVLDTMNARHHNHLDILVYTSTQERFVGWRKNVQVRVLTCSRT